MIKLSAALHGLLPMQDRKLAYITKRFDRHGKEKIAAEDLMSAFTEIN